MSTLSVVCDRHDPVVLVAAWQLEDDGIWRWRNGVAVGWGEVNPATGIYRGYDFTHEPTHKGLQRTPDGRDRAVFECPKCRREKVPVRM